MTSDLELSSQRNQIVFYWWRNSHRGPAPPAAVDFIALAREIGSCIVLDVQRDPDDFMYRFIGSRVEDFMGGKMTGRRLSEFPSQQPPSTIWSIFCRVRDTL